MHTHIHICIHTYILPLAGSKSGEEEEDERSLIKGLKRHARLPVEWVGRPGGGLRRRTTFLEIVGVQTTNNRLTSCALPYPSPKKTLESRGLWAIWALGTRKFTVFLSAWTLG